MGHGEVEQHKTRCEFIKKKVRVEKVWFDEKTLFGKPWERYILGLAVIRWIKEASVYDTGTGRGKIWVACRVDGKAKVSGRTDQGTGPDVLSTKNE